jgi:beta-ribofuranosylaminobenzene 5'-phosphate synthase
VSITVAERIPEHVGLGSGTQLALAVGAGLAVICGIDADLRDVARALHRGRRSGIGIAAFRSGGLIIDAGVDKGGTSRGLLPTVVWRHDFPSDWCFVVAIPAEEEGLSGHSEEGVFAALAPSVRISEEVCRLTQLQLMPALVERDIEAFGSALTAIDRKTGAFFCDVQGGVYSRRETNQTIAAMLRAGAAGAGQTSWGPAVYGLVHESEVGRLEAEVRGFFRERGLGGSVFVGHGRNTRARVEVQTDAL